MKILLCEDDPDIMRVLQEVLEHAGCQVQPVVSGYQALEAIKGNRFDGVVTDYNMAQGDGGMLAHHCNDNSIPCIVITHHEPTHVRHYLPATTNVFGKDHFVKVLRETKTKLSERGPASDHPLNAFHK